MHKLFNFHSLELNRNYKREVRFSFKGRVRACRQCNGEKADMLPQEWFARHPAYKARFIREAKYLSNEVKRIAEIGWSRHACQGQVRATQKGLVPVRHPTP